jgi:hypothetical protein
MFGTPGCASWDKRLGTELYYDQDTLLEAVFYLRENGASYLKIIPIRNYQDTHRKYVAAYIKKLGLRFSVIVGVLVNIVNCPTKYQK